MRRSLAPYPLLAKTNDSYRKSSFDGIAALKVAGKELRIEFRAVLRCAALKNLVRAGLAGYALHVESPVTSYRRLFEFNDAAFHLKLSADDVRSVLQVTPFVVAKAPIEDYASEDFHEAYAGQTFSFARGHILAFDQTTEFLLHAQDERETLPSIMRVEPLAREAGEAALRVDCGSDYIVVRLVRDLAGARRGARPAFGGAACGRRAEDALAEGAAAPAGRGEDRYLGGRRGIPRHRPAAPARSFEPRLAGDGRSGAARGGGRMELSFMTQTGVDDMKTHVEEHAELYRCEDNAAMLAHLTEKGYLQKADLDALSFVELLEEGDHGVADIENVRRLYGAWRTLPPYAAADERLWAGLSHTLFWRYIHRRKEKDFGAGKTAALRSDFFFAQGRRRSLFVNPLARLWWAGRMVYDERRRDPFELLPVLAQGAFASQLVLFASSGLMSRRETRFAVLSLLERFERSGKKVKREHLQALLARLNAISSLTLVDMLSEEEIEKRLEGVLFPLFENRRD